MVDFQYTHSDLFLLLSYLKFSKIYSSVNNYISSVSRSLGALDLSHVNVPIRTCGDLLGLRLKTIV